MGSHRCEGLDYYTNMSHSRLEDNGIVKQRLSDPVQIKPLQNEGRSHRRGGMTAVVSTYLHASVNILCLDLLQPKRVHKI